MNSTSPVGLLSIAAVLVLALPGGRASETQTPEMQATLVAPDDPAAKTFRDTGDRAIDRLAITMITDVTNSLARHGPVAAMEQCHLKDVPMKEGFVGGLPRIKAMKLTSLKLRNPANAPDPAETAALEAVRAGLEAGSPPPLLVQRVTLADKSVEWRVYKPLANIRQCGSCHAKPDDMPPELRTALAKKYPQDQATGYATPEWRGLIRVTVAEPPPPAPPPAPAPTPAKGAKGKRA